MTPDDPTAAALDRCRDFLAPGWVDVENASPECVADLLTLARAYLGCSPPADVRAAADTTIRDYGSITEYCDRPPGCRCYQCRALCMARWVAGLGRTGGTK